MNQCQEMAGSHTSRDEIICIRFDRDLYEYSGKTVYIIAFYNSASTAQVEFVRAPAKCWFRGT